MSDDLFSKCTEKIQNAVDKYLTEGVDATNFEVLFYLNILGRCQSCQGRYGKRKWTYLDMHNWTSFCF